MRSIWSDEMPRIRPEKKTLPQSAEVVIIGGGMAGLLCAYLLIESGIRAIILEAEEICSGQTRNTTAKITSQHGLIYSKLADVFDDETAVKFGRLNERAIDEYERIVRGCGIACGFRRLPSYLYTKTELGAKALESERIEAKRVGIRAAFVHETELPFPVKLALKYENQAQFHPLEFLRGIIGDLEIYEHMRVIRVKGNEVITGRGTVRAKHIIFATHYPFMNVPGFYFTKMHQERSYVLGVRVPEVSAPDQDGRDWKKFDGMYYGIDQDGLSFRSAGDVILIGGKSHRTGEQQAQDPYKALRKEAELIWPEYEEITSWSAQDCMTLDSLPYIGRYSKWRPNWYVATGFEKWGMTGSMAAAMVLRDMVLGKPNPYAAIVSPQRRWTKRAVCNLFREGINTVKNFVTFERPRCPHLGCRLKWNRYEHVWECPCHGSRFHESGKILDNPAQKDLKR